MGSLAACCLPETLSNFWIAICLRILKLTTRSQGAILNLPTFPVDYLVSCTVWISSLSGKFLVSLVHEAVIFVPCLDIKISIELYKC